MEEIKTSTTIYQVNNSHAIDTKIVYYEHREMVGGRIIGNTSKLSESHWGDNVPSMGIGH